ncbi:MAG: hypothetical protein V7637_4459 [Mycobacteriales bacterium]|jgi:tetratricopeptide (TPR) repeat protein
MSQRLAPEVEVLVLGPVAVRRAGEVSVAPAGQLQALVGVLALAGRPGMAGPELEQVLWPDGGSGRHRSTLPVAVHRARRWLREASGGGIGIGSTATGYVLAGPVDADRFRALVSAAEPLPPGGQVDLLGAALALWRADAPLPGVACGFATEAVLEGLHRARLAATVRYGRALLAVGRGADAVEALSPFAARHPLDEQVHAVLIEALAGAGRQAEALARYERLRSRLADELGVDPGRALQDTLMRVLRPDDQPEPPPWWRPDLVPVPAQLPPETAGFAGRAGELAALDELRRAASPLSVVVSALDGIGGVGKSALAVRWAHRVAAEFPDGQLHVDLRGYAHAAPVRPAEALGRFLRALGVPAERVPADVAEAAALYRSLLAGRRVLVLLDNARDVETVRPLLPGAPGCLALVTSRGRLDGLVAHEGARRITLDVLGGEDALHLLAAALGDSRVAAEPAAAAELAVLCGYLPLALRIMAARLAADPSRRLADQVAELRADRWAELSVPGDPRSSVRATFDLSYRRLDAGDRRLFRLLALAPGADIGVPAAAALAATPAPVTRQALRRLVAAHLVAEQGDRYSMHDLVRLYAAERAAADGGGAAERQRLLAWYLRGADTATRLLHPQLLRLPQPPSPLVPPEAVHTDHAAALAWLDAEWRNLAAAAVETAERGPAPMAVLLADSLRGYFWQRRNLAEWIAVASAAVAAATGSGDLPGQAAAQLSLGMAVHCAGRSAEAIGHHEQALALSAQAGWSDGESGSLANLGLVYRALGKLEEAADHHARALARHQADGRPTNAATDLGNLGVVYFQLGRLDLAADHFTRALAAHRGTGYRDGQALALNNLGETHWQLGRLDEALESISAAYALYREGGSLHGQADTQANLAAVQRAAGRGGPALEHAALARRLAAEAGDQRIEATAANITGTVFALLGRYADAVGQHQQALQTARAIGAGYEEVEALLGLAAADRYVTGPRAAVAHAEQALALAERGSYGLLAEQAKALLAGTLAEHGTR